MLPSEEEDLILRQALRDGLLTEDDLALARDPTTLQPRTQGSLGPRIDNLIQHGRIATADVLRLKTNVVARESGMLNTLPEIGVALTLDGSQSGQPPAGNPEPVIYPVSVRAQAQTMASEGDIRPSVPVTINDEFPVPHWDKYEFLCLLGRGGMGSVYKARDRRLGRTVALKFIHGDDPGMIQRFLQEARAQARLVQRNICNVYEVGFVDKKPYIAMEFVDGVSLDKAAVTLGLRDKLTLMKDVALAMHFAHEQGVIHRDLKPSNIMVDWGGSGQLRPVVMDFGLARDRSMEQTSGLTQSGAVIGTPAYMSPEQARGEARWLDQRSDVYSLGATLYEVLVGKPPFDDETVVNVILKVLNDTPPTLRSHNLEIPEALELVVSKCLNKEADQRYPSALALAEDLDRFLKSERVTARRLSLSYRARYFATRNRGLSALAVALFCSLVGLGIFGAYTRIQNLRKERLAQRQAALQKRLGQEMSTMEWMLRSARQLPLHDLEREKVIIRERMAHLDSEMASYGELGRGLAHYALGRGHMALHEYAEALRLLQQSIKEGNDGADVQYALGFVLGKHFEQAIYEARLSGGGDWAQKQLKELEPKYLNPAIASLEHGRAAKSDTPSYLEALIAYYKRDYPAALKHAEIALRKEPWLYEAIKLAGDVHLDQALRARDSGQDDAAAREFADAVRSYTEASSIGQSDGEVYEGLAEAWLRQVEMAAVGGQRVEQTYAAAIAASDKITAAEPKSIAGPLKKARATMMTMAGGGYGTNAQEGVRQCLSSVAAVLQKQPGHPYARDTAASCYGIAAENARTKGENPEPLYVEALKMLEPAVHEYPHFLWGLNDLGNIYLYYGVYLRSIGNPTSREYLDKAIKYFVATQAVDATYVTGPANLLGALSEVVPIAISMEDLQSLLKQTDAGLATCLTISKTYHFCYINYVQVYARAAMQMYLAEQDPQLPLDRAFANVAVLRKLGGNFLDVGHHDALAHLVDSASRVRRNQDPGQSLDELQAALQRCFALAAQDAICRTLAAQAALVGADWLARQEKPFAAALKEALAKAQLATQSPEPYPDSWQVLAETHLRMARAPSTTSSIRDQHLIAGLAATDKIFAINPNHALGWATRGALELARAKSQRVPAARRAAAQSAVTALQRALKKDQFLKPDYEPLLAQANELSST